MVKSRVQFVLPTPHSSSRVGPRHRKSFAKVLLLRYHMPNS